MRKTIREKYNDLVEDLYVNYDKVKVIDNFDWNESNPYTIFYLNNNESFGKFEDLWKKVKYEAEELDDYSYDDILNMFEKEAYDKFDYVELGTLDIYTKSEYELDI